MAKKVYSSQLPAIGKMCSMELYLPLGLRMITAFVLKRGGNYGLTQIVEASKMKKPHFLLLLISSKRSLETEIIL